MMDLAGTLQVVLSRYGNRLDVLPLLRTEGFSRRISSFCLDSDNPLSLFFAQFSEWFGKTMAI